MAACPSVALDEHSLQPAHQPQIKLRTNSHHLATLNDCVTLRPEFPDHAERVPGATPLVLCTMTIALHVRVSPSFQHPPPVSGRPLWSWGRRVTDMRTMFTAVHLAAPLASFVHSFPAMTDDQPGTAIHMTY
jgi:hypothetical protein